VQRLEQIIVRFDLRKADVAAVDAALKPVRDALAKLRNGGPKDTAMFYDRPRVVPLERGKGIIEAGQFPAPFRPARADLRRAVAAEVDADHKPPRAGARRMLEALARRHPVATTWSQARQLAGLSDSGTFSTYCGDLRRGGYVQEDRDYVALTDDGWAVIGRTPGSVSAQTTEEMVELYAGILRGGARRMLTAVMAAYPRSLLHADLATAAGIVISGTFSTYLGDLRRAGLVEDDRNGGVRASELLMNPAGAA
jgi:hypothetical protein